MRWFVVAAGLLALGGCGVARRAEMDASADQARSECKAQTFKTQVAKIQCLNRAAGMSSGTTGEYSDLLQTALAYRLVLAEKVDSGRMSEAEAEYEYSRYRSEAISTVNTRAAQAAASRPTFTPAPIIAPPMGNIRQPVTCTTQPFLGNLQTTCR